MEAEVGKLRRILRKNGYSLTKARRKVFTALWDNEPQTTADIIQKVTPIADRASVYRSLKIFEELGIIERVQIGWKYKLELSEMFRDHHHHLTCVRCERVVDVFGRYNLEVVIDSTARDEGYEPLSHHLEIQGLCPQCQHTAQS